MQLRGTKFNMAIYSTPGVNDTKDLQTIFRWVNNEASGGLFFPIVLLAIWVIAFVGAIAEGREAYRAWIFACFITTPMAILLGLLGFLSSTFIYFLIILLGFGLIWARLVTSR